MKFKDFAYNRPNIENLKNTFEQLLKKFKNAQNAEEQTEIIHQINDHRGNFDTMSNLAYVRYSMDTNNTEYEQEQTFFDENLPIFQGIINDFYAELIKSPFKAELKKAWGKQLFAIAETALKTFNDSVIEDLQKENALSSDYMRLIASAAIEFEGKKMNLAELAPYTTHLDRNIRKAAADAKWEFFEKNSTELDQIFDDLVKVRHTIAQKLGYNNFVELSYNRLARTDYNAQMVANFRQQVLNEIVPLTLKLDKRQAKRLDIENLKYYDYGLYFKTGNPKPKGSPEWIVENSKRMYQELSTETNEFFNFMMENELMDLVTRKGKAVGGYCTYISGYQAPFIFSNFNGTAGDITVLTHEAGHAFQVYMSRQFELPEYYWPTYEACEIHSMSMELMTWPWMEYFFKEDTEKFKFEHLSGCIFFLPYGVAVDEFQHYVYENPTATPQQRKQKWSEIEHKYQPGIDYDNNPFLENGGRWQQQSHIYHTPFYYIDYTLAQICAFQFWKKFNTDRSTALNDYIRLCSAGGSKSFLELVEYANLESPFDKNCLKNVVQPVQAYLDSIDDLSLN